VTDSVIFAVTAWRKSSHCAGSDCVELAQLPNGGIAIRNSDSSTSDVAVFTRSEIEAFLKGAKAGEFDDLTT
jgi:hypothetical protein